VIIETIYQIVCHFINVIDVEKCLIEKVIISLILTKKICKEIVYKNMKHSKDDNMKNNEDDNMK
jgi:hypothetical protein